MMRLVLIIGIVFIHIPYDPATSAFAEDAGVLAWIRVFLGESLFRVGVPCLSAISGYLLFRHGSDGFRYLKAIRARAQTVLLPFLIWNIAFLTIVLVLQAQGIGFGYLPDAINASPYDLLNLAVAIDGAPINMPLYFLRDLMICMLLAPVLAAAIKRYPLPTLAILMIYAVLPMPDGIFLRRSIPFGFSCGIYAAIHTVDVRMFDKHAPAIAAVSLAASALLATALLWSCLLYTSPSPRD